MGDHLLRLDVQQSYEHVLPSGGGAVGVVGGVVTGVAMDAWGRGYPRVHMVWRVHEGRVRSLGEWVGKAPM